MVVLPCKVGDVVYGFHVEKTILPMVAKWIETNTDGWCIAVQLELLQVLWKTH